MARQKFGKELLLTFLALFVVVAMGFSAGVAFTLDNLRQERIVEPQAQPEIRRQATPSAQELGVGTVEIIFSSS